MRTAAALILLATAPAMSQSAILIDIDNLTLRPGESTIVTLWAAWPEHEYAFARTMTNLETSVGSEGWSGHQLIPVMDGPGTTAGMPTPTGYDGIFAWQINIGPTHFEPDFSNPIAFWQATYTAPDDPPIALDIDLMTRTAEFEVYFMPDSLETHSYLDDLVEGSATIHVIPAPAGASVLALGLAAGTRRRR